MSVSPFIPSVYLFFCYLLCPPSRKSFNFFVICFACHGEKTFVQQKQVQLKGRPAGPGAWADLERSPCCCQVELGYHPPYI
ncbi:hypothetical protein SKAU_G00297660 [Synaphobranchus kaupii]|uniref:Uncharacterized protein n=1 Tax=Synaphobranchus kaupii TaxID=118154 RepID=A0A9Q1EV25_SYNKA|nr:hypothetical protein SKAU_G00297660 [Synaphobranchus kaupii]